MGGIVTARIGGLNGQAIAAEVLGATGWTARRPLRSVVEALCGVLR
jgi:hypothetical protein